MIEQVVQTRGVFLDFAPQVRRIHPLAPAVSKPKRIAPVVYLLVLPEKDYAPGLRPTSYYYDPTSPLDPDWRRHAVCAGKGNSPKGISKWFPGPGGAQTGKLYCAVCPVRRECKRFADDNAIEWGIWGGEIRHRLKKSEQVPIRETVAA